MTRKTTAQQMSVEVTVNKTKKKKTGGGVGINLLHWTQADTRDRALDQNTTFASSFPGPKGEKKSWPG